MDNGVNSTSVSVGTSPIGDVSENKKTHLADVYSRKKSA